MKRNIAQMKIGRDQLAGEVSANVLGKILYKMDHHTELTDVGANPNAAEIVFTFYNPKYKEVQPNDPIPDIEVTFNTNSMGVWIDKLKEPFVPQNAIQSAIAHLIDKAEEEPPAQQQGLISGRQYGKSIIQQMNDAFQDSVLTGRGAIRTNWNTQDVVDWAKEDIKMPYCNHKWLEYQGLEDSFEFCEHCDEKRTPNG